VQCWVSTQSPLTQTHTHTHTHTQRMREQIEIYTCRSLTCAIPLIRLYPLVLAPLPPHVVEKLQIQQIYPRRIQLTSGYVTGGWISQPL
jgi:hypothetical protein